VIFVGSLNRGKRVNLVVEALKGYEELSLAICGSGKHFEEYVINTAHNFTNIEYKGHLDRKDLQRELANSSVLVVPSLSESFGLVYIEALIAGVAIIGYENVVNEFREL